VPKSWQKSESGPQGCVVGESVVLAELVILVVTEFEVIEAVMAVDVVASKVVDVVKFAQRPHLIGQ
jgi:hypothetical protein